MGRKVQLYMYIKSLVLNCCCLHRASIYIGQDPELVDQLT